MKKNERMKQSVKFLKWTRKYGGWWYLICTPNDEHMNIKMMKLLIEQLAKESFYEIIFVLMMVHRDEKFMEDMQGILSMDLLIEKWKNGNQDEITTKLIGYLE